MSPRQRIKVRASPALIGARVVVAALALALVWYGLMVVLLALEVSPHTVNALSAYRTIYDYLAGLDAREITSTVRIVIAASGVAAFLVFGSLAFKAPPRPFRARRDLDLALDGARGDSVVEPRAIERLAEIAALEHGAVTDATGRYAVDELTVSVTARAPAEVADTLDDVQRRVARAVDRHQLPAQALHVELAGLDSQPERTVR